MHELGLAEAALQIALAEAGKANAARVHRIVLRVGALSGVDPDALRFALASLLPGTAASGAELEIDPVPAIARCAECGRDFQIDDDLLCECPTCGRPNAGLRQGRELELFRLELC